MSCSEKGRGWCIAHVYHVGTVSDAMQYNNTLMSIIPKDCLSVPIDHHSTIISISGEWDQLCEFENRVQFRVPTANHVQNIQDYCKLVPECPTH